MKPPQPQGSALRRASSAVARFLARLAKLFVIALLVIVPVPVLNLFPRKAKADRKNLPAEVLRKD